MPPKFKLGTNVKLVKETIKCSYLMQKMQNDFASMENVGCVDLTEKELLSQKPEINARLSAIGYEKSTQTQVS